MSKPIRSLFEPIAKEINSLARIHKAFTKKNNNGDVNNDEDEYEFSEIENYVEISKDLMCKTYGNAPTQSKAKVMFACHPNDFERFFDKISRDVFKAQECAIYYQKDVNAELSQELIQSYLGQFNLLIIPVTHDLLSTPDYVINRYLRTAEELKIPVLPFMMEAGLDELYSMPENFGALQYLNPHSIDKTEINYEKKLNAHLEAVLVDEDTVDKVRKAFRSYVFLSYRKKDRKYATELMKCIHAHPSYRDVAIWYDEFLTPGQSFEKNIEKYLTDSKLFFLLVTPSLLEMPNGTPNFVMKKEFPAAHTMGKTVIPTELVPTPRNELEKHYPGLPECIDFYDTDAFNKRLSESVGFLAPPKEISTPEHDYLIGLAYLHGIDVEVDHDIALQLITSAAEKGYSPAMHKLDSMYYNGIGVPVDYKKAIYWTNAVVYCHAKAHGKENEDTLQMMCDLSERYYADGQFTKALHFAEMAYSMLHKTLGSEHEYTRRAMALLALCYEGVGNMKDAFALREKIYYLNANLLGMTHEDTLSALTGLVHTYRDAGKYNLSITCADLLIELLTDIAGDLDSRTISAIEYLAITYGKCGYHEKAKSLLDVAIARRCETEGEDAANTLYAKALIAMELCCLGDTEQALRITNDVLSKQIAMFGDSNPVPLGTMNTLNYIYITTNDRENGLKLAKTIYEKRCAISGEEHPNTLVALNNLAVAYKNAGDNENAVIAAKKTYELREKTLGPDHPDTLMAKQNLRAACSEKKDVQYSYSVRTDTADISNQLLLELEEMHQFVLRHSMQSDCIGVMMKTAQDVYRERCKLLGENHYDTVASLGAIALLHGAANEPDEALKIMEKVYPSMLNARGEVHPYTTGSMDFLYETRTFAKRSKSIKRHTRSELKQMFKASRLHNEYLLYCKKYRNALMKTEKRQ